MTTTASLVFPRAGTVALEPHLLTEAVNAVRTAMLAGDVSYVAAAAAVIVHRESHAAVYGWPPLSLDEELALLQVVVRRARDEDNQAAVAAE